MKKEIKKQNNKTLFNLNNAILITSIITLVLGIADWVLDMTHHSGNPIGIAFLVIGIIMSLPGLAWLIMSIILLAKDKKKEIVDPVDRKFWIMIIAISFAAFIPLWIEGFIPGNDIPTFDRVVYRQVIWTLVWIVYLCTCLAINLYAWKNRCRYLYAK